MSISGIHKGTKLKEVTKDYMLRVRIDNATIAKLDSVCEKLNTSRSEVVRIGIEEMYQKEK